MDDTAKDLWNILGALSSSTGCAISVLTNEPSIKMKGCYAGAFSFFSKIISYKNDSVSKDSAKLAYELFSTAMGFGIMYAECTSNQELNTTLNYLSKALTISIAIYDWLKVCNKPVAEEKNSLPQYNK